MYPRAFEYRRAGSYPEAVSLLSELGEEARLLAGGQSLIPLMKLRLSAPRYLVDLNFIPETSYVRSNGSLCFGAMTRHAEIAASADAAQDSHSPGLRRGRRRSPGAQHGNHRRLDRRGRSYR